MLNVRETITRLPLWSDFDYDYDDDTTDELQPGDLVYWEEPGREHDTYGIGILKTFGYASWRDECYGILSAYIISTDDNHEYGRYIPLTHIELADDNDLIDWYGETYDTNEEVLQALQHATNQRRQDCGWTPDYRDMPVMFPNYGFVQGRAS